MAATRAAFLVLHLLLAQAERDTRLGNLQVVPQLSSLSTDILSNVDGPSSFDPSTFNKEPPPLPDTDDPLQKRPSFAGSEFSMDPSLGMAASPNFDGHSLFQDQAALPGLSSTPVLDKKPPLLNMEIPPELRGPPPLFGMNLPADQPFSFNFKLPPFLDSQEPPPGGDGSAPLLPPGDGRSPPLSRHFHGQPSPDERPSLREQLIPSNFHGFPLDPRLSAGQPPDDLVTSNDHHHVCTKVVRKTMVVSQTVMVPCSGEDRYTKSINIGGAFQRLLAMYLGQRVPRRLCQKTTNKEQTLTHTVPVCCEGWTTDDNGYCNIPNNPPVPSIHCQNGGTPAFHRNHEYCNCPKDFKGKFCEELTCSLDCFNGGICENVDGNDMCMCPSAYHGILCEIPVPKDGRCPLAEVVNSCPTSCSADFECPGVMKCCGSAVCEATCVFPSNVSCEWRGQLIASGEAFCSEPGKACMCQEPNRDFPEGGVRCHTFPCPAIPSCNRRIDIPGRCCEMCQDPVFFNCPSDVLSVNVSSNGSSAVLDFPLQALDFMKNSLQVSLSAREVSWLREPTRVTAKAVDDSGAEVVCVLKVQVRDPHPPLFTFCPKDQVVTGDETAFWEIPVAVDNVGLKHPPQSSHKPDQKFPPGETTVEYRTEDLEGNLAVCHFVITVNATEIMSVEAEVSNNLLEGSGRDYLPYIIAAAMVVVIATAFVIACTCRKRKKLSRDSSYKLPVKPPSYENSIYTIKSPPIFISLPPPETVLGECMDDDGEEKAEIPETEASPDQNSIAESCSSSSCNEDYPYATVKPVSLEAEDH